jgi:hypothetical protein
MKFHFLYLLLAFIVTSSSCSSPHTSSRKWEVISSKDYADQVQIGQGSPVIYPIQLQDDKFLFCLNNNLYIKHLQDDITAIVSDIFTDFTVDTAVPSSWQGQWIIQNDEMCYFTTIHQADEEFSFNLCCKNPPDHRSKWETILFSEKNFSLNHRTKLIEHMDSIIVQCGSRMYSVEKETGIIQWEVSVFSDILPTSEVPSEKQFQNILLYPLHIGQSGIVYHFSTTSIEGAYKSPESIDQYFFLSWDGSQKNLLSEKPVSFYQDFYLYFTENAMICASSIDNQLQWDYTLAYSYPFAVIGAERYVVVPKEEDYMILDKTTGMMESKFPKVSGILKDMQEQDGLYYWWATSNSNAQEHLLYTWKPGESVNVIELSETIGIPSWTNEIVEIASFQTETLLFLSAGYLEVGNSTVEYTPYIVSSDEGDTNPISSYHPYVFSQNELFVVALTPIDRGFVMGGKIIEIVPSMGGQDVR